MINNLEEIKTMHNLIKVTMNRAFSDDRTFDENFFVITDSDKGTDSYLLGHTAFILEYLMFAAFKTFGSAASIGFTEDIGGEPVDFTSVYEYQLLEFHEILSRAYEENKKYEIE